MKYVEVQFTPWDKCYTFSAADFEIEPGNYVIVETKMGTEIGRVVGFPATANKDDGEIKPILRKATTEDMEKALEYRKLKVKALDDCKIFVKKYNLPMKLVDAYYSFDDARLTFAFIANGRVDFRELVKEITKHFKRSIRLQQIGIRDEIKLNGDIGCCGRSLCCQTFYRDLGNVTSDFADLQQVAHRGSDRLSGVCGRLKCCLTYEHNVYQELAKNLPAIGSSVKTEQGKGVVIGWHILKQTVDVRLEGKDSIIEWAIKK
jgi:cell fate regulator YaaT (PSP1 superfamily)